AQVGSGMRQLDQPGGREGPRNEQGSAGAVNPSLGQLKLADYEVLSQEREPHGLTGQLQVSQAAAEAPGLSENGERRGTTRFVGAHPARQIQVGSDYPLRRGRPLDLADERHDGRS